MEISFRWSSKWPCPESRRNSVLSSISCVLSPKAKGGEGEISGDLLDQGLGGARGVFDQDMTTDSASDSHKESSLILKGAPVEQEALSSGEGFGTFLANSIDEAGQKIMHVDEIGNLTNTGNSKLTDTHDEISHDDLTSSANSNQNEGQSSTFQSIDGGTSWCRCAGSMIPWTGPTCPATRRAASGSASPRGTSARRL